MCTQAESLSSCLQILGYLPVEMSFSGFEKNDLSCGEVGTSITINIHNVSFKGESITVSRSVVQILLQLVKGTKGCQRLTCTTSITFGGLLKILGGNLFHH